MAPESILYTTLLLFGSTIVAAAAAFARCPVVGRPPWPPDRGGVAPLMRPDVRCKQAVLRCGRCGRVAAWPDARLQVVCGCRARVDLAPPLVREATPADRALAEDIFRREFGGRQLVADGQPITLDQADLLVAETEGGVAGALAWRRLPDALHIIALATDPMWQRAGVGSYLLAEAEAARAPAVAAARDRHDFERQHPGAVLSTSAGATG